MPDDTDESSVIDALMRRRRHPIGQRPKMDIGDDAAVTADGLAVASDAMVEGVHFDQRLSPADVGWKLVAVNLSDLGAVGASPDWALLTLALPSPLDMEWVRSFSDGLHEALDHWGTTLLGGDTVGTPGPRMASLTVGGQVGAPVPRSGARAGDDIWVTGNLGDAAAGFFLGCAEGLSRLRRPLPPVGLGACLADAGVAHAMMDLSDGLHADLVRLCTASCLGASVDPAALPRGSALDEVEDPIPFQVAFGEDYELLFAADPRDQALVEDMARVCETTVHRIGQMTQGSAPVLEGVDWPPRAFSHFSA